MKKSILFLALLFVGYWASAQSFRPPAYPLITVDPYFSVWSFNDNLNESSTVHWTGKDNSLQGIIRVDGEAFYFLGQPIPQLKTVVPLIGEQGEWKYTLSQPDARWNKENYNPRSWNTVTGAFSDADNAPNHWKSPNIWVRRTFQLADVDFDNLQLNMHHDDNVKVYIN